MTESTLFLVKAVPKNEKKLTFLLKLNFLRFQESNISRYYEEFVELELIGAGEFGSVYKCINRLDGCVYAIKKSIKPVAGSVNE